jgi:MFS family permease
MGIRLFLGLLLSTLETTIISTALVTIASDLGNFDISNWVVVSYLVTYTGMAMYLTCATNLTPVGFLIIYSRCSDIFGRKSSFLTALIFFVTFSLACGVARTMKQLYERLPTDDFYTLADTSRIVFRAFQGLGGSGIYSMAMAVMAEVTPQDKLGPVTGLMSSIFALSSILGPVLGGAITSNTTWRWVFYLK